jgi:Zn finger protein HypA/HybF involved in hydrogenase expression
MGHTYGAKCGECGAEFEVSEGGGFTFHLLHCDRCGKGKSISFDKIGELHLRYVKGLDMPYSTVTWDSDRFIQETYTGEPISEAEYHQEIEKLTRKCRCGGRYRFDAPPRCPKCRSTDIEQDPMVGGLDYD